jgi:hypothetical protein
MGGLLKFFGVCEPAMNNLAACEVAQNNSSIPILLIAVNPSIGFFYEAIVSQTLLIY